MKKIKLTRIEENKTTNMTNRGNIARIYVGDTNRNCFKNIDIEVIFDDNSKMTIPINMKDMAMISPYIRAVSNIFQSNNIFMLISYSEYLLYSIAPALVEFFRGLNIKIKYIHAYSKEDRIKLTYHNFIN